MPAGGRGYTRPPTLISLWSTAPYLLNNRLGRFDPNPAVANRVKAFDASIRQLLWPETRDKDPLFKDRVEGVIDRTRQRSWLFVPDSYIPSLNPRTHATLKRLLPARWRDGEDLKLGPIPAGVPISALTNINPRGPENDNKRIQQQGDVSQFRKLFGFVRRLAGVLFGLEHSPPANDAAALKAFEPLRDDLRGLSKCPDFVVNRGHYFGTDRFVDRVGLTADEQWWIGNERPLGNPDKEALIAFLKTF
jgi:hypothetical protein